jgi:hypothetical protein
MESHKSAGITFNRSEEDPASRHNISNFSPACIPLKALLAFKRQNGVIKFRRSRTVITFISYHRFPLREAYQQLSCHFFEKPEMTIS